MVAACVWPEALIAVVMQKKQREREGADDQQNNGHRKAP
jgi:hypothetical protein